MITTVDTSANLFPTQAYPATSSSVSESGEVTGEREKGGEGGGRRDVPSVQQKKAQTRPCRNSPKTSPGETREDPPSIALSKNPHASSSKPEHREREEGKGRGTNGSYATQSYRYTPPSPSSQPPASPLPPHPPLISQSKGASCPLRPFWG